MHRRDFIKVSAGTTMLSGMSFIPAKAEVPVDPWEGHRLFLDLFTKMDWSNQRIEPLIFEVDTDVRSKPGRIRIDPYTIKHRYVDRIEDEVNKDAIHTILAAGIGRGMLVWDGDASTDEFSLRLVSVLNQAMRRNDSSLTRGQLSDIFMRKSKVIGSHIHGVKIHAVHDKIWDHIEDYYLTKLNGSLQDSDKNLVIGVNASTTDTFVYPIFQHPKLNLNTMKYEQLSNVVVLDNRKVLLGSF